MRSDGNLNEQNIASNSSVINNMPFAAKPSPIVNIYPGQRVFSIDVECVATGELL